MRRAINEIVDPGPRSIDELWSHFDSRCAYCGNALDRSMREGHADHADPNGGNHLGNLVLACGPCNGDEKRDESWLDFLHRKVDDPEELSIRKRRILVWIALKPRPEISHGPEVEALRRRCDELVTEFGVACAELRIAARGKP
jgi:hypothetical protein